MASTYTLISSNTLSSSAASVTFSSIPQTYTDLVLRMSVRGDSASVYDIEQIQFNNDSTSGNYSFTLLWGSGSAATSGRGTNQSGHPTYYNNGDTATSNSFGNGEIYIPSYTVAQNKPMSQFQVAETNAATERMGLNANLWRNTAAISSIQITPYLGTNMLSGSSFYLYGIKKS